MLDKSYLKEIIQDHFPDLANTKFNFNNVAASNFTEQSLLPFLIYQNTIDKHHRLIGLYLPESCSIINLVPFYVMMGQYRKAVDNEMQAKNYQNQTFKPNQKQVVFNGDVCSISSVDFINRELIFKSGRGKVINMPFWEIYKINWSKNSVDIRDKIESFEIIDKAGQGNIFTFPIPPKDSLYEGVIIFTNTSKFESLLRSVEVSGTDLRDHLNIQKVVFPSNDEEIRFLRLSKSRTGKKPVSLLIARHDAFRAYDSIVSAGAGSLNHIKTIIIDDFDELISRWERSDCASEEISKLKDNYFQKLRDKQLKDLYFISRNSNIYIHGILKDLSVDYNPWLLKPLEEFIMNNEKEARIVPGITVTNIGDIQFEDLIESLNILINKWKVLAQTNFLNGEILNPINCLYELRTKLNSFFDPERLNDFTESFSASLDHLRNKWFAGGQDYNTIEETKRFIGENFNACSDFVNFKLESIKKLLKLKSIQGPVTIVSDNNDADDVKWLLNNMHGVLPGLSVTCSHKKDFFNIKQDGHVSNCIIFYLTSDKKIIGAASGNLLAEEQVFILNKRAYSFTESYLKKCQRLQMEAGSTSAKHILLNINETVDFVDSETSGLIPVHYDKQQVGQVYNVEEPQIQELELQDLVDEVIQKQHYIPTKGVSDKYLLFFDDGSLAQFPESRHFFLYEDDKESGDFDKSLRTVTELQSGDEVIVTRRGLHVKDLLEQTLKKHAGFSNTVEMDEKWRILINNHIRRCGIDLSFFCKKLLENGFKIGPAAVRNWIDGETQRPENFKGLLLALSKLGVVNKDEISAFDKHNSELKSIQIGFVRTAIRRLIARLNGINLEEDEVFTDDLLSDFINHIEIKRITAIYKL